MAGMHGTSLQRQSAARVEQQHAGFWTKLTGAVGALRRWNQIKEEIFSVIRSPSSLPGGCGGREGHVPIRMVILWFDALSMDDHATVRGMLNDR